MSAEEIKVMRYRIKNDPIIALEKIIRIKARLLREIEAIFDPAITFLERIFE